MRTACRGIAPVLPKRGLSRPILSALALLVRPRQVNEPFDQTLKFSSCLGVRVVGQSHGVRNVVVATMLTQVRIRRSPQVGAGQPCFQRLGTAPRADCISPPHEFAERERSGPRLRTEHDGFTHVLTFHPNNEIDVRHRAEFEAATPVIRDVDTERPHCPDRAIACGCTAFQESCRLHRCVDAALGEAALEKCCRYR